jgi:hypothetical protein
MEDFMKGKGNYLDITRILNVPPDPLIFDVQLWFPGTILVP